MGNGPEEILELWLKHVNEMKVDDIVKLYDDGCTLLPTFSPKSMRSPQEIREYFEQLSTREDMSVELHSGTVSTAVISESKYIIMGIYSFHFNVNDAQLTFPSRFTFILDASRSKPILHHHSSQIPRALT